MAVYQIPKVMFFDDGIAFGGYFDPPTIWINCGAPKMLAEECNYCMTNDMDIRLKDRAPSAILSPESTPAARPTARTSDTEPHLHHVSGAVLETFRESHRLFCTAH